MSIQKADNAPGYGRDPKTGAIININTSAIGMAKKAKENRNRQKQEIEELKQDVHDIKSMLAQIIEKL
mgnify:CR=1 FL=1|jgi:hypothetical protein